MAPNDFKASDLYAKLVEPNSIIVGICLAPYCQISRELNAQLPKIATEFPKVQFYKINTEKNEEILTKFNVQTFPYSFVITKKEGGDPYEHGHVSGNKPDELKKILEELTKPPEIPKSELKESDSE
ncbi:thioredoxin m(mitochondrial)-type [Tritrichomonas foetus]|uniref:Thioredoxin m(Mitochondrial)-type n=1 Tax=Tritrichomonas foetus TaxID=1144522 RepID=A0A1J4JSM4_9EUKA|nr:thioredoxin m(mitochondrial)-type [Tritrichomonas foetus]|eukprot:OHT02051.1 thioredoxin m(mitochondrial)-type [Tritrichomonas foetus]